MRYALAISVLLALLLLVGCGLVEEWKTATEPPPAPADCPDPPPCPNCDCPECPSTEPQGGGPLLEPSFKEQYLVELLNEYRQGEGLPPLEWNGRLYIAAVLHAQAWTQACRTREGCSDQCWKNDRCPYELSLAERLQLAGYSGSAQELLAAGDGYYDSRDVLADWTDREWYPAAYAALTNPAYREVACSFVRCHKCWVHTIYVCLLGAGEGDS
jgi:hypothetical protein